MEHAPSHASTHHAHTRLLNVAAVMFIVIAAVWLLVVGKALLLPFVAAVIIWYFMESLSAFFKREAHFPGWLALALSILSISATVWAMSELLYGSVYEILRAFPKYQTKLEGVLENIPQLLEKWHIELPDISTLPQKLAPNVSGILSGVAGAVSSLAGSLGLVGIYVLFLLMEHKHFAPKLKALCAGKDGKTSKKQHDKAVKLLKDINHKIGVYVRAKTALSALTGFLTWLVLWAFGVDFASFWGILTFLLNFIPNVGSIIAVILVIPVVLVQFEALPLALTVVALLMAVQFTVGNVLEPRLLGNTLNLSPLVILLSLAFWGAVWGVAGMLLCVPIMAVLNIILANFEATKRWAVLLSQRGEV